MDWIAVTSGFSVGAIVGVTGVGGGSLMTPLLIGVFKLNPRRRDRHRPVVRRNHQERRRDRPSPSRPCRIRTLLTGPLLIAGLKVIH